MKVNKIFSLFILSCFLLSCGEQDRSVNTEIIDMEIDDNGNVVRENIPVLEFNQTELIVGKITQGEVIEHVFTFVNSGDAPLVIASVEGSCGCTIPRNYPKGKILPGEGGEIEVEFDSDGKSGNQTVSIIVSANTIPSATQLIIRADIIAPNL